MKRPLLTVILVRFHPDVEEAILTIARASENEAKLRGLETELRAKKDELAHALQKTTTTGTAPASGAGGITP